MFLTIKKIPKTNWSSPKPLNFKPRILTFLYLCLGLTFFGLGEGLLLVSSTGASPWSVLAQGISLNIDFSIGTITLFVSIGVLILWIPLKQKPGIGTILNALIIAVMIDICINFVPAPQNNISQIVLAIVAVLHPGTCDTNLSKPFQSAVPKDKLFTPYQSSEYLINIISEQKPSDSGKFLAWDRSIIPW